MRRTALLRRAKGALAKDPVRKNLALTRKDHDDG
jgi:hypothetical protein